MKKDRSPQMFLIFIIAVTIFLSKHKYESMEPSAFLITFKVPVNFWIGTGIIVAVVFVWHWWTLKVSQPEHMGDEILNDEV